jgi:hypothetical protein
MKKRRINMFPKQFFIALGVLALASLACSITFNAPEVNFNTGPTVTDEINVPLLSTSAVANVEVNFGAGNLNISPGAENALISGTATYNVKEFKPTIDVQGDNIRIAQEGSNFEGIPKLGNDIQNTWDLNFNAAPMDLRIAAGAYRGRFELGGLAIENLRVSDGAAETQLSFSQPNQTQMQTLRYETGASKVTLIGLANANFQDMTFRGGAGDYRLEFSGDLQRDATVNVQAGLSNVVIVVPEGTNVNLSVKGGLTNVDARDSWRGAGQDNYTLSGSGPQLTINVDLGAGNLELRNQ